MNPADVLWWADESGEPMQRSLVDAIDVRLPLMDLQNLDLNEREERASKIIAEQGSVAFDFRQAPLFRGVLLRMGEREHVFDSRCHHILCDEWSQACSMEELAELYEEVERGEEPTLPQTGNAIWGVCSRTRKEMRAGKFQRQMEYWKAQLAEMPQALELQIDHARPCGQSFPRGIHIKVWKATCWRA